MNPKRKPPKRKLPALAVPRVAPTVRNGEEEPDFDCPWTSLSPSTKARFDRFVAEFVFDYNATAAAMRMGYAQTVGSVKACQWLRESYVQFRLREYVQTLEAQTGVTRGAVMSWLVREANDFSPGSTSAARVTALKTLAKALGMNVLKVEQEVTARHVMEVPLTPSVDVWSSTASAQQKELKDHADRT